MVIKLKDSSKPVKKPKHKPVEQPEKPDKIVTFD